MRTLFLIIGVIAATTHCSAQDRQFWAEQAYRMAAPVLSRMAEGRLQQEMELELAPGWLDERSPKVAYLECFGRLMAGLAPWLALPDDDTAEGRQRRQLREWALKAYANAVDPNSPDCLDWTSCNQVLVDAAYLIESFHRAYDALWVPLDTITKQRYIERLRGLRSMEAGYSNWVLFPAMAECFIMRTGGDYIPQTIHYALNKIEEWYVGDGWYSDGPAFAFDYYNSFDIHPMYIECLEAVNLVRGDDRWLGRKAGDDTGSRRRQEMAVQRMQKYGVILERFISPEATFPVVGRSIPYRMAVFQPLAMLAWKGWLPKELPAGQVRSALTAVMHRMLEGNRNYNSGGYLTIGFMGSQTCAADWYTNNGSLYITSQVFLPLGLPADHEFWTAEPQPWTSLKAWRGDDFPKDHKWDINPQILHWK